MAKPRMRTLLKEAASEKELKENINWLVWLEEHTCRAHNVAYSHHPNCYYREYPNTKHIEKLGFLDIEATNLKANFGVVICWCIKPARSKTIIQKCVTPAEMKGRGNQRPLRDKRIIGELADTMRKFDRLIVHYGTDRKFDFPFLRSRALTMGLDFPTYREVWTTDTWNIAKSKLCLSSNRLATIADFLHIKIKKTPITTDHWLDALAGYQESLDYILDHCDRDVLVLEKVYNKIWPFAPRSKTSV